MLPKRRLRNSRQDSSEDEIIEINDVETDAEERQREIIRTIENDIQREKQLARERERLIDIEREKVAERERIRERLKEIEKNRVREMELEVERERERERREEIEKMEEIELLKLKGGVDFGTVHIQRLSQHVENVINCFSFVRNLPSLFKISLKMENSERLYACARKEKHFLLGIKFKRYYELGTFELLEEVVESVP